MEFIADRHERLDKFLASRAEARSRSEWHRAIKSGVVKVNGHFVTKQGFILRPGDRVLALEERLLTPVEEFLVEPKPDLPLEVIYEDMDMVGVNKPAGLLVHPTPTHPQHTLANALLARYPEMRGVGESPLRPGIVHRLDRNTSGVLVAARTQAAFVCLKGQFLERKVRKTYLALVVGVLEEQEDVIEYPIRPTRVNRLKKTAVRGPGTGAKSERSACTSYRVAERFGDRYALLEVEPKTGRTHQVRVHLKAIGHPIVGDELYARKSDAGHSMRALGLKRQFLHAWKLTLTIPSGRELTLVAELSEDLREVLARLRGTS